LQPCPRSESESGAITVHDEQMKTFMKLKDIASVDALQEFLSGTRAVAFSLISDKEESYRWL